MRDGYALSVPSGEEPVKYGDVVNDLIGEKVKAENLVGETFLVLKGRPFASSYEDTKHDPRFVICVNKKTGEKFHTILGGEAIVPILIEYAASNPTAPLEVTLNFIAGQGKHDGYYTFS